MSTVEVSPGREMGRRLLEDRRLCVSGTESIDMDLMLGIVQCCLSCQLANSALGSTVRR